MCLESFEPGAPPDKVHRVDNLQANKDKHGMLCFLVGSLLVTVDGIGRVLRRQADLARARVHFIVGPVCGRERAHAPLGQPVALAHRSERRCRAALR